MKAGRVFKKRGGEGKVRGVNIQRGTGDGEKVNVSHMKVVMSS